MGEGTSPEMFIEAEGLVMEMMRDGKTADEIRAALKAGEFSDESISKLVPDVMPTEAAKILEIEDDGVKYLVSKQVLEAHTLDNLRVFRRRDLDSLNDEYNEGVEASEREGPLPKNVSFMFAMGYLGASWYEMDRMITTGALKGACDGILGWRFPGADVQKISEEGEEVPELDYGALDSIEGPEKRADRARQLITETYGEDGKRYVDELERRMRLRTWGYNKWITDSHADDIVAILEKAGFAYTADGEGD